MYCTNCGNELPENSKFCNHCGYQLEEPIEEQKVNQKEIHIKKPHIILRILKALFPIPLVIFSVIHFLWGMSKPGNTVADGLFVELIMFIVIDLIYHVFMSMVYKKNFLKLKIDMNPLVNRKVRKALIAEHKQNDVIYCPRCASTQLTSNAKGFSAGKAAAGYILAGGIGLAAGGIGSGKAKFTCLNCGNSWTVGK